jgi:hypothetical protein
VAKLDRWPAVRVWRVPSAPARIKRPRQVIRAPFALLVFVVASAFAKSTAPEVMFISPCECHGFHGKNRWIVKTDFTPVPLDKSAIQSVTPSQIYPWEGLGADAA